MQKHGAGPEQEVEFPVRIAEDKMKNTMREGQNKFKDVVDGHRSRVYKPEDDWMIALGLLYVDLAC